MHLSFLKFYHIKRHINRIIETVILGTRHSDGCLEFIIQENWEFKAILGLILCVRHVEI